MNIKILLLATAALPLLAGCDVFRGNDAATSTTTTPAQFYVPAFTDGGESDVFDHLIGSGVTGYIGNSDGTVSEVLVRFSEEDEVAYISIDGGPEVVYELDGVGENKDGLNIELVNEAMQYAYLEIYGYESSSEIYLYDDETEANSEGHFGLQTASEALPTETAIYSGYWQGESETDSNYIEVEGDMTLAVGFGSGTIAGSTEGYFDAENYEDESYDYGEFIGGVTGTVEGSRIVGTMSVEGDASGSIDFMGAIYGEDAEQAAGGVGGTLTSEAGEMSFGGEFDLYNDGEFDGCNLCD